MSRILVSRISKNAFLDLKGPNLGKCTRYVEERHDDSGCFIYYSRFVAPLIRITRFLRSDTLKKSLRCLLEGRNQCSFSILDLEKRVFLFKGAQIWEIV